MFDVSNTCRTCMKISVALVGLFEPWSIDQNSEVQLAEALMQCTTTMIEKEDGLPQNLCQDCLAKLEISYTFRNQAQKAEIDLRKSLSIKIVKNEPSELKLEYFDNFEDLPLGLDFFKDEQSINDTESVKTEKVEEKVYECFKCQKHYASEKKFIKHLNTHEESILKCEDCAKCFHKKSSLEHHRAKYHNSGLYSCVICCQKYDSESVLQEHMICHSENIEVKTESGDHSVNKFKCSKCDLSFSKLRSLASHAKKHTNKEKQRYQCDICHTLFARKGLLKRHFRLHSDERPFACTQCPNRYSRKDQLDDHVKKHNGIKPNVCPYCNKGFTQLCNLKDHIRTHTGETPFLCSDCGRGFNNSSNLRQHMKRHTGVKPFACNFCPKTFVTKGQMNGHMETHTGAHPYTCDTCGANFTKPQSLRKHANIHLGIKPFPCDACPQRFYSRDHLKRHQRIHTGEKPYLCRYCDRGFTQSNDLTKHLRTHIGQNIYQCTVCDMRFRILSELKKHYPIHYTNNKSVDPPSLNQINYSKPNTSEPAAVDKENSTADHTITITFNDIPDKDTGITGSITINMNNSDRV